MKITGSLALVALVPFVAACSSFQTAATPPVETTASVAPPASPAVPPAAKADDESLTIAFPTAGATLSPQALSQLDGAARLYRDAKPEVMIVAGHTDKSGNEYDNLMLSAKRAQAVKEGLVDRGVPADRLQIVAIGEAEPNPTIPPSRAAIVTWR